MLITHDHSHPCPAMQVNHHAIQPAPTYGVDHQILEVASNGLRHIEINNLSGIPKAPNSHQDIDYIYYSIKGIYTLLKPILS